MVTAGAVDLQDLRAQVAHIDAPGDRIAAVDRIFKHHVRITGFELDFRQQLEKLTGVDAGFANALVIHHLTVFFANANL